MSEHTHSWEILEEEPDIKSIEEARFISAQTRIQDEKEAAELGMSYEEFLRERDEMMDDKYSQIPF